MEPLLTIKLNMFVFEKLRTRVKVGEADPVLNDYWERTTNHLVEIVAKVVIDLLPRFTQSKLHLTNHKRIFEFKVYYYILCILI